MGEVAEFFDEQQKSSAYKNLKKLTQGQDRAAAQIMNGEVGGRVLSIGGVWEFFEKGPRLSELTVMDVSEQMLQSYAPAGSKAAVGDLYSIDLPAASFDSVVFSLILHHVAQGDWAQTRERVRSALARAFQWLKPGGKVFIIEACPAPAWMLPQRLLLPFTKLFLKAVSQPLVVMHERAFYENTLSELGFSRIEARRVMAPGTSDWTWFPVFMAVSWLRMPLKFYPKMHIFTGEKPGGA